MTRRVARRIPGRMTSVRRDRIWTTQINADVSTLAGIVQTLNFVDATDWERNATAIEKATCTRIRGNVGFSRVTAAEGTTFCSIRRIAIGETIQNPGLIGGYQEENVMWTAMHKWDNSNTTPWNFEIDVKVQRKLTSNDIIMFSHVTFNVDIFISHLVRTLVTTGASS